MQEVCASSLSETRQGRQLTRQRLSGNINAHVVKGNSLRKANCCFS